MSNIKLINLELTGTKLVRMQAQDPDNESGKLKFQHMAIDNDKCYIQFGEVARMKKEKLDLELFEIHLLGFSGNG
ncbi:MAG: hypothetical protein HQL68_03935 [Magnetococcales bacterium]|nr:hypothetical protein [Magnetococcales bacterium]